MKTLILSDLHLGSKNCQTGQLLETLKTEPFDRLVLNGDTVHGLNFKKFKRCHWEILDHLRRVVRSREVILLRGNHDSDPMPAPIAAANGLGTHSVLPSLLGVAMVDEWRVTIGARNYLVLHGDRFDGTLAYPLVSEAAGWCYDLSAKIHKKLARWLKKKSKRWTGVLDRMKDRSVRYAREHGCDGVITGHTHFPDDCLMGEMHYVNSGCWTEPPCTYLTAHSGQVSLHHLPD